VRQSPERNQQQQGDDSRRPQPGQEHTAIQISILTGCFRFATSSRRGRNLSPRSR
jgi:hypothetical protein